MNDDRLVINLIKNLFMSSAALAATIAAAAPLPNNTFLSINPGTLDPINTLCTVGSCFSIDVIPAFSVRVALESGTDGGIILGKNQIGGGQQTGTDSVGNATPGQITKASYFFGQYGTFGTTPIIGTNAGVITTDSVLNVFDSASCTGAACNAVTKLGTWNWAWSGMAIPLGSNGGCPSVNCTANQQNGIFVSNWTVNPDNTYVLDYSQMLPDAHPSGFGGTLFSMHLAGNIVGPVGPPIVNGFWPGNGATNTGVFLFGKNFKVPPGAPKSPIVKFNGGTLQSFVVQVFAPDLLYALQPAGTVQGKITVTTDVGTATSPTDYNQVSSGLRINGLWPGEIKANGFAFVFGQGFSLTLGANKVDMNGVPVTVVQVLDQSLLAFLVPLGSATGPVHVTTGGVTATSPTNLVILP